jgi:hypothetical protein
MISSMKSPSSFYKGHSMPISYASSLLLCLLTVPAFAADEVEQSKGQFDAKENVRWYDIRLADVEGQGWTDLKAPFDRLPAKAEKTVRPAVWGLSRNSAGILARFTTDATVIKARWTLTSNRLAMPHMPATGVSGLDLYVHTGKGWRWLGVGQPTAQTNIATLVSDIPKAKRDYLLYLPLYNGVSSVEIGLPDDSPLEKSPPRPVSQRKPLVFYGTSITHGASASRPGMVHTAILGRKLNRPVINLGFSGNGQLEKEVAELLAELDPAVFVIDCLPNVDAKAVTERTEPLVRILRTSRPETPILLVEDRTYANSFLIPAKRERNDTSRAAFKAAYERLQKAGVKNLHYLEGEYLLGADGEDTVDSSHPTDLGFMRQAEAFEKALRPILEK